MASSSITIVTRRIMTEQLAAINMPSFGAENMHDFNRYHVSWNCACIPLPPNGSQKGATCALPYATAMPLAPITCCKRNKRYACSAWAAGVLRARSILILRKAGACTGTCRGSVFVRIPRLAENATYEYPFFTIPLTFLVLRPTFYYHPE